MDCSAACFALPLASAISRRSSALRAGLSVLPNSSSSLFATASACTTRGLEAATEASLCSFWALRRSSMAFSMEFLPLINPPPPASRRDLPSSLNAFVFSSARERDFSSLSLRSFSLSSDSFEYLPRFVNCMSNCVPTTAATPMTRPVVLPITNANCVKLLLTARILYSRPPVADMKSSTANASCWMPSCARIAPLRIPSKSPRRRRLADRSRSICFSVNLVGSSCASSLANCRLIPRTSSSN